MRGLIDKKHYEKEEVTQIVAITDAFKKAFPKLAIPDILQTVDDSGKIRANYSPNLSSYSFSQWAAALDTGESPLREGAEQICILTCTYQNARYARGIFNSGYLDEPIQLLLEFLKEKMVEFASIDTRSEASLTLANQWLAFIVTLLQTEFFLPKYPVSRESLIRPGISNETLTFYSVLLEIRDIFKRKIVDVLERELANRSAREHLHQLISACDRTIYHAFLYLTCILRGGKNVAPSDLSMDALIEPLRLVHLRVAKTLSGQSLSALAWVIHKAKHDPKFQIENQFLSNKCEPKLLLWDPIRKVATAENIEKLCEKKSELADYFRENNQQCIEIRNNFIRLHGLVVELVRIRKVWQISYELAGMVGDLGLYGASNVNVNSMILVSESLMCKISETLVNLNEAAYMYYKRIFATGSDEASVWRKNYRLSWVYYEELRKDIVSINAQIGLLMVQVNSMSLPERLEKARKIQGDFHEESLACVKHVSELFSIPIRLPSSEYSMPALPTQSEPRFSMATSSVAQVQRLLSNQIVSSGGGTRTASVRTRSEPPRPARLVSDGSLPMAATANSGISNVTSAVAQSSHASATNVVTHEEGVRLSGYNALETPWIP